MKWSAKFKELKEKIKTTQNCCPMKISLKLKAK